MIKKNIVVRVKSYGDTIRKMNFDVDWPVDLVEAEKHWGLDVVTDLVLGGGNSAVVRFQNHFRSIMECGVKNMDMEKVHDDAIASDAKDWKPCVGRVKKSTYVF